MRHIPTSTEMVEKLKKQAKKLQRNGGGKHADLLDRVARGAGYLHWHHVVGCQKETESKRGVDALLSDIAIIQQAAVARQMKVVITGPEAGIESMLMFSTEDGDAWMLDPSDNMALCLAWQGQRQEPAIRDNSRTVEIGWDGTYELVGPSFALKTTHPLVGDRVVMGYPVDELRPLIDKTQDFRSRFRAIFGQEDSMPLTADVVQDLLASGMPQEHIDEAIANGFVYSPSRKNFLGLPEVGGFDADANNGSGAVGPR